MADDTQRIYWDADVFLAYIKDEPDRASTIESLLDLALEDPKIMIVTSAITRVEVSWTSVEYLHRVLLQEELDRIDSLLGNYHIVELVEFNDTIALIAREHMRKGMETGGKKLRTNDAIHLASAIWIKAKELNTYNMRDYHYFEQFVDFPIREPVVQQPKLFNEKNE